ncbi:MAG: GAF domain-containing protein [Planctomycetaceae bacterium]|nr:GAF domain-containing protein [Planctomycetaceae bacterium]
MRLADTEVSRLHATLHQEEGRFMIVDENSSNGTLVNGKKISRQILDDGDTLLIGRTTLMFSQQMGQPSDIIDKIHLFHDPSDEHRSSIVSQASLDESQLIFGPEQFPETVNDHATLANLQALYRITEETVSSSHSLDQILQQVLEEVLNAVGAERGCMLLKNPANDDLEAYAVHTLGDKSTQQIPVSRTIVDYVQLEKRGVRTSDAQQDQRFQSGQSILKAGIREAICVPMQGKYDQVGVVYVDTTRNHPAHDDEYQNHFTEAHLHLLMAVGRQAALTVENHRYQEALIRAERMAAMGEAVAAISHHIKNILQGIRGGVYLIDNGLESSKPEVIRSGWEIVDRNQNRIYNLVQDMLSVSKDREPDYTVNDLSKTVEDAIQIVSQRAEEAGVEIRTELDHETPESRYDVESIHRSILNLLTNALDAVEEVEHGILVVKAGYDAEGDRLYVSVADNGPGIPEDQRQVIFEAFHSTKGGRGTGLGLAVSRKIIHEHDGELIFETKVGQGSRFTLTWPVSPREEAPPPPGSSVIRQDAPN